MAGSEIPKTKIARDLGWSRSVIYDLLTTRGAFAPTTLSLAAVAAEAGVSKGLLWHYFADGDELMEATARPPCTRRTTPNYGQCARSWTTCDTRTGRTGSG